MFESIEFEIDLREFAGAGLLEHIVLEHEDLKAVNTAANPDQVAPHKNGRTDVLGQKAVSVLNKHSWNVIRFTI
jgi:alpha-N-arabinofuranosidase